jgi:hypothetical protein
MVTFRHPEILVGEVFEIGQDWLGFLGYMDIEGSIVGADALLDNAIAFSLVPGVIPVAKNLDHANKNGKQQGNSDGGFVEKLFVPKEQFHLCKSTLEKSRVAHHDLLAVKGCFQAKCAPLLRRRDVLTRGRCYCARGCLGGVVISGGARLAMARGRVFAFDVFLR